MREPDPAMPDAALLAAYDAQLRDTGEIPGALRWERLGPVVAAEYAGGRGFVTYRALDGHDGTPIDAREVRALVERVLAHFRARPNISEVEWKTRGHDHAPGLDQALRDAGFVPQESESIMIGEAAGLAVDVPLPAGVTVRRIDAEVDVRRMVAMQAEVFANPTPGMVEDLLRRLASSRDELELWIAETTHDSGRATGTGSGSGEPPEIVSAGRLELVPGTDFAGIWGGCTRASWRGRGIYRALTAERARSALRRGKRLINSDSTEFSRPILQRSGLRKVGTTTPYVWRR